MGPAPVPPVLSPVPSTGPTRVGNSGPAPSGSSSTDKFGMQAVPSYSPPIVKHDSAIPAKRAKIMSGSGAKVIGG